MYKWHGLLQEACTSAIIIIIMNTCALGISVELGYSAIAIKESNH